ncbi:MAG: alpha/beta hydrolase [Acidobacteriota bacterium]
MIERLFVEERPGDGAPIVFLHGLGATHRYWHTGLMDMDLTQPLVMPDLLGFGDSPKPWCRYTLERHLAPIAAALAPYSGATLVGHSMGAALALAHAARHPDTVRAVVLLSLPYFGSEPIAYRWFRRHPTGWLFTNMAATALACMVTRRIAGRLLPRLLPDLPREIAEDLVKHNFFSSTTSLWEVLYRHEYRVDADVLAGRVPVYCLHGTADSTAPADRVRLLAADRPNWTVELLPGVGHHPWLDRPQDCRALLMRALGGAEPHRIGPDATAAGEATSSFSEATERPLGL